MKWVTLPQGLSPFSLSIFFQLRSLVWKMAVGLPKSPHQNRTTRLTKTCGHLHLNSMTRFPLTPQSVSHWGHRTGPQKNQQALPGKCSGPRSWLWQEPGGLWPISVTDECEGLRWECRQGLEQSHLCPLLKVTCLSSLPRQGPVQRRNSWEHNYNWTGWGS